ncbi:MAG: hypothetical protein WCD17_18540 [Acinetobacter calcoaceticus]
MNKKVNFCFDIGKNDLRRFLSIEERNNGDLLIMPSKPDFIRQPYFPEINEDEIKQQKYSIHMSPNSNEFNVCMHNLDLKNSINETKNIRTSNFTKVIKSNTENLSPLFFCSQPDLSNDKYKLKIKDKEENLILDKVNLNYNTILYGIFICKNNAKKYLTFSMGNQNYKRLVFKNFTIIFVWTYWNFMSTHIGSQIHITTYDAEKMKKLFNIENSIPNNGYNGINAKNISLECFNMLREDIHTTFLKIIGNLPDNKILLKTPFSKQPFQ